MKFVYHNLKMLMNRTRYNGWVLGELFVVFIVLWFLCDSIGCFTYTLTRPLGFDYSHVYECNWMPEVRNVIPRTLI